MKPSRCDKAFKAESVQLTANKSLQLTFDPPPTFAAAKAGVASNAAELRR